MTSGEDIKRPPTDSETRTDGRGEETVRRAPTRVSQGSADLNAPENVSPSECKLATILVAAIPNFRIDADSMDAQTEAVLLNECFERFRRVIEQYDGFMAEFTGETIMGVFGVPVTHEDDAERACRAAVKSLRLVEEFSAECEFRLGLHIGIDTGNVTAVRIGDRAHQRLVFMGETVKTAKLLKDSSKQGEILVSQETYRLISHLFTFQNLGPIEVPGHAEGITSYRLLRAQSEPSQTSRMAARGMSSRFVGRQAELEAIRRRVERILEGHSRFISVIGEAGIGKSRLVAELRNQVMGADPPPSVQWLEASAGSMGKVVSYGLFRQLIWEYAGITEQDDEDDAFQKLQGRVGALFKDNAAEIMPYLATMISLDVGEQFAEPIKYLKGEAMRRQVFLSSRLLFERIARRQPLVLVFEDVQWIDESSALLLEHLLPLMYRVPLLMLGVSRPAMESPLAQLLERLTQAYHDRYDEIRLQPLSPPQSAKLVANLLHNENHPPALDDKIIDKAEGNAFFIEEIIRSLIDEKLLYRDALSSEWRLTADVETMNVPRTIQGIIMARVDLLDTRLREVVKVAAVVGRRFLHRVLLAVVQPAPELGKQLAILERLGLILEDTRTSEAAYLFNHDLAHEAIYENLDDTERKTLHARVGSAIEQLFAGRLEEYFALLAYHYSRAEMWEKAQEYLFKAGEEASRSAASNEALHHSQEALRIYRMQRGHRADPETVAMREKNIGFALFSRGYYDEAVVHFDKALKYFWGEFPANAVSAAFMFLSSFTKFLLALNFPSWWFKRLPSQREAETVDLFYKRAEALVVINPKRFLIESFFFYGKMVHFDLTRLEMGMAIFAGASALFSFTGLSLNIGRKILDYVKPRLASDNATQWLIYDLLDTQNLFLTGRWDGIAEYDEELVNRSLRIGETFYASQHYYWHGLPKIHQGHFNTARFMVTKLSEFAEAYDNDIYRLMKYLLNAHLLIECRHLREATAEVNRGIELVQRKGWTVSELSMHSLEAMIHLLGKETEKARASLDKADQIRSKVRVAPMQISFFYRSQFEYYLHRLEDSLTAGHREGTEFRWNALKSGEMLIKTCQKAALYRTDSYRLMGVYNWLINDRKSAFNFWNKAISEGGIIGARPQLSRTYAEMGMRPCAVNGKFPDADESTAKEHLQKAKTMFRDMELHHDLEHLNSTFSQGRLESPDL
ncbi:MAG: DUF2791 family P-loop domain-containing protein [Deltaproteobacteria bacterium]